MEACRFLLAVSLAVGAAAGPAPPVVRQPPPQGTAIVLPGCRLWIRGSGAGGRVFTLYRDPREADSTALDAAGLAGRLHAGTELSGLAAPFTAVAVDQDGRVTAATDHAGLGHVYAAQGAGWSAVASSALELARQRGGELDVEALGEHRLIGHFLGTSTAFRGVAKLGPGQLWRLAGGSLTTCAYPTAPVADCPPDDVARRHAARLREVVGAFLDHYPDAVLELSGGLDSRLVLAAVPPGRRAGLRAFTLTQPGATDGPVAAALADRCGLVHQTVDVSQIATVDPAQAYQAVYDMAVRTDASSTPLSLAVFAWAEGQVEPAPRLGGHGGELARGAYYLQRQRPRVEPGRVDQLARWWLIGNNAVADAALSPQFAAESRERTLRRLRGIFAGYDMDWLSATDEYYLRERLHRWAGLILADAARSRPVTNPLLDPQVLALTRAMPRERRSGSRYAAQVLDQLDPELARQRLGSGLRPVALSRRLTLSRQLGENTVTGFARKAVGKVSRRLLARGRPAVGAAALGAAVVAHWRANPDLLAPVAATGLVSQDWLAKLVAGTVGADPATVDFLVNLAVAASARARPPH